MQWNEVDCTLPVVEERITGLLISRPVIIYNARNDDAMIAQLCGGRNSRHKWWIVRGGRVKLSYATHWAEFPAMDVEQKISYLERYWPSRGY